MKVLVTAGSKHGATEEIARAISDTLVQRGIETALMAPEQVTAIGDYDAMIVGSAIYAGRWQKEAKEFVERYADVLADQDVWLFSSGPLGDPPKPEGDPAEASAMLEATKAHDHHLFAGKLDRSDLGFTEKAIVKAVGASYGDYRDWDEVEAWSSRIADHLLEDESAS